MGARVEENGNLSFDSLEEILQSELDEMELSGELNGVEEDVATIEFHQDKCPDVNEGGECDCLPIFIPATRLRKIGSKRAAEMLEPYLKREPG